MIELSTHNPASTLKLTHFTSMLVLISLLGGPSQRVNAREWMDKSGKHRIQGRLISIQDDRIGIKTADGRDISVKTQDLGTAEQAFVARCRQCLPARKATRKRDSLLQFDDLSGKVELHCQAFFETINKTGRPAIVRVVLSLKALDATRFEFVQAVYRGQTQDASHSELGLTTAFRVAHRLHASAHVKPLTIANVQWKDDFASDELKIPHHDWASAITKTLRDWRILFARDAKIYEVVPEFDVSTNSMRISPLIDNRRNSGVVGFPIKVETVANVENSEGLINQWLSSDIAKCIQAIKQVDTGLKRNASRAPPCPSCNGSGKNATTIDSNGLFELVQLSTCPTCQGTRSKYGERENNRYATLIEKRVAIESQLAFLSTLKASLKNKTTPANPFGNGFGAMGGNSLGVSQRLSIDQQLWLHPITERIREQSQLLSSKGHTLTARELQSRIGIAMATKRFMDLKRFAHFDRVDDLRIWFAIRVDGELRNDLKSD